MANMQEVKVKFVEKSMDLTGRGAVTGIAFFDFGTFQFPDVEWSDAIVVILGWWLAALADLLTGEVVETELRFMEGPFFLSLRRDSGDECHIRCLEGPKARKKFECRGSVLSLMRETLEIANRVQQVCHQHGWRSADVHALEGLVGTAQKLAKEQ